MNDRGSPSVHDALFLLLSDLVSFERLAVKMQPQQMQRYIRRLSSQLSDMLPEIEELDQLDDKVAKLEKRIRILGLSSGEDIE